MVGVFVLTGVGQGVEVGDVEFVGAFGAVGVFSSGDAAAAFGNAGDEGAALFVGEDVFEGTEADAVVGGGEVEEGAAWRQVGQGSGPFCEVFSGAGLEGVEEEWGEGELIDHVGLVAGTEVGEVFAVGDVCFGDEDDVGGDDVEDVAQEFDDLVGLGEVDAGGADLFPEIGDGVESDDPDAAVDVVEEDVKKFEEDIGIGEVEVNLVFAEGGPDVAGAVAGLGEGEEGVGAGSDDGGEVGLGVGLDEVVAGGGDAADVVSEPATVARAVIEDEVGHEAEVARDGLDVFPGAEFGSDLAVVNDAEAVV